jgi:hypothetical protein
MAEIADELLRVAVGCREAGVPRDEATGIVADAYSAPWSNGPPPVDSRTDFARRLFGRVFAAPRAGRA